MDFRKGKVIPLNYIEDNRFIYVTLFKLFIFIMVNWQC